MNTLAQSLNTQRQQVEVLLPVPGTAGFDYLLPAGETAVPGAYVSVPFGKKTLVGVVWGASKGDIAPEKCKEVAQFHPTIPPMTERFRAFMDWVAWYNCAPRGAVLKLALSAPEAFVAPKRKLKEKPLGVACSPSPHRLNEEQQSAAEKLASCIGKGFSVELLEGLTGSGKTEVYFDTIEKALTTGAQVLVLLPEIALGAQWVERCEKRFGFVPEVWHSGISKAARRNTWQRAVRGEARLVVGARSALFLPMPRLGLMVVDEEHEPSYKQEDGVIYHARDMAVARAKHENIPLLLVSATPSLETLANVEGGRYGKTHLPSRFGGASLPHAQSVDMRLSGLNASRFLSPTLEVAVREHLARGEQSLLFLNRRGYAPLLLCRTCGHRMQCPSCTAWLVLHKRSGMSGSANYMQCHHCGYAERAPDTCPSCASENTLAPCGPGVERIEEEARALFPEARLLTIASDHVGSQSALEESIARITNHEADIIIGTQLLAKGHHFPHLTLIGVVDADLGLRGGDLRATERTWQLLHQLSGRAGREQKPGMVLIQTYQPEHPVMVALANGDGAALIAAEMKARKQEQMPPYGKLGAVIVESEKEEALRRFASDLARALPQQKGFRTLGPAPAPLYKLRNRYRLRFLTHASKDAPLQGYMAAWLGNIRPPHHIIIKVDIDPQSFL